MHTRRIVAVAVLALCACSSSSPPIINGDTVIIPLGGSLTVHFGDCARVDLLTLQIRANFAVDAMQSIWGAGAFVDAIPVFMSTAGAFDGEYFPDDQTIALGCGREERVEHQLYHAIGHKLGIPCWETIAHAGTMLDCMP